MAKIALRAYNREIETLIDRGQIEEAIAHCKYILRFFPKHIETYRLLGKAYIESQRYSEAADILQRILSVLPDDFIAQVGMSIIREDENNLDAAIFHMEHAHEIQPSNAAVQDELRRLYGRRDGVEPPRLRLTRGALVRLYAKGDLYRQAIAEIRAALTEDPNRYDLEVVLARMYNLLGQKVEATDVASRLVSKLPYCMEANRILAEILPTTARAEDAKTYQSRVFALDPYLAYISTNAPTINLVPDNAVTLDHLEFQPTAGGEEQPAWAQTAGIDIGGTEEAEAIPEWMTSAPENTAAADSADSTQAPVSASSQEPASAVSTEMPEWMQDAGWGAAAQGVQEPPHEDEEEAAAPGELPDWLKEMAPKQEAGSEPQESDLKMDWLDQVLPEADSTQTRTLDFPTEGEVPPVASIEESEATGTEPVPASDAAPAAFEETLPAWLTLPEETPAESEPAITIEGAPETELPPSEIETFLASEYEQPATMVEPVFAEGTKGVEAGETGESAPQIELPVAEVEPVVEGIESLEAGVTVEPAPEIEQPVFETEPAAAEGIEEAEVSEAAIGAEETETTLAAETAEGVPDMESFPSEVEMVNGAEALSVFDQPSTENEPIVAEAIAEIAPSDAVEGVSELEQPAAGGESVVAPEAEATSEAEQLSAEVEAYPAAVTETPEEDITKPVRVLPASEPATVAQAESQAEPDLNDLDAAMAWLEGLAAKQGADEDTLSTSAEERSETPPDWVTQAQAESQAEVPVGESTPALPTEAETIQPLEMEVPPAAPDMIIESVSELAPEMPAPAQAETASEIPTPITESSLAETPVAEMAEAEIPAVAEEPLAVEAPVSLEKPVAAPVTEAPAPESIEIPTASVSEAPTQSVSGEMDADAAFAWLESLAAQQGADEATLSTSKEEREVAPPSWVTEISEPVATEPESPISQDFTPEVAAEATAELTPELPPTPDIPAFEVPESSQAPTQPIPVGEWIQEVQPPVAPEPAPEPVLAAPVVPQEEPLPAWLEGLDQPPAGTSQLVTPEGMEDLPDWLKGFDTQPEPTAAPEPAETVSVSSWLDEQAVPPVESSAPVAPAVEQSMPNVEEPVTTLPGAAAGASPATASLKGFSPSDNPLIVQAQAHLGAGEVDPALDLYNKVIGEGHDHAAVIQDLSSAASRYPGEPSLWQTLGDAYMRNDQIQEALDAYTKAEELLR